jgi:dihydroflavonol-4-reductase
MQYAVVSFHSTSNFNTYGKKYMILITGANGFVGSYLCRYLLQKGEHIRALKREHSDLKLLDDIKHLIEWVDGDVTDIISLENAMTNIDVVYHTAAIISYLPAMKKRMMEINVDGTANVVNTALYKGIKRFLYISSIAALGRQSYMTMVDEQSFIEKSQITSGYSLSKFLAEREVWRGIGEGLNAVIINPSIILGAGNWDCGSCKLFTTIYNGFKYYTSGATGYVDVRDVVKISVALVNSSITGERFILNSENKKYKDILFAMADGLHVKRPSVQAGKFLSALAWRGEALKAVFKKGEPTVTKATAKIANAEYYFDNKKIVSALQYTFIPIDTSIAQTSELFLLEKQSKIFDPLQF